DRLAAYVSREFGRCDALINNAGIPGGEFRTRDHLDDALRTLDVNISGAVRAMAAFGDLLRASAPSRVINVASVAGKLGVGPAAYAASKFALVGFSEATAFSWSRDGIAVCQLNPGFIRTEGFPQKQILRTPAARIVGDPDDVARAIHRALVRGAVEYTVPRWYRALVVARHVAAPLYWPLAARMARATGKRD
ncbi:MAG: SDR family oxidoreductase, partial [Nitriliruptoraceae bacterium]